VTYAVIGLAETALKLRAFSLAVALAVPLTGMRGLCFMSSDLPGTARSEHECCKAGLKLARSNCCMAVTYEQAPARTASRLSMDLPTAFVWTLAPIDSTMTGQQPACRPSPREHDPPEHTVLRI
jgi:hypothetical protein